MYENEAKSASSGNCDPVDEMHEFSFLFQLDQPNGSF